MKTIVTKVEQTPFQTAMDWVGIIGAILGVLSIALVVFTFVLMPVNLAGLVWGYMLFVGPPTATMPIWMLIAGGVMSISEVILLLVLLTP